MHFIFIQLSIQYTRLLTQLTQMQYNARAQEGGGGGAGIAPPTKKDGEASNTFPPPTKMALKPKNAIFDL